MRSYFNSPNSASKRKVNPFSSKTSRAFTLVEIMIVVVIIGLLASLAIPAFKRIHQTAQDRTVLNNARQIVAASNQYFLETGATSVDMSVLIGYYRYIKDIQPVAGEVYPTVVTSGVTLEITNVGGSRTITMDL